MSVSMFANALRAHSRVQVLTATRVALPASRSISSLVGFRTAVPKNVSTAVSRSFTTSQVACNDYDGGAVRSFEGSGASSPVSDTIFIANIAWGATEEDISDVFSEFGEVRSVRIHLTPEGRSRGIAHCTFASKDSAIAAIESAAQEPIHMSGRDLRVDFSAGNNRTQAVAEPNEKLYFSGCAGDESDIRKIFEDFESYIMDIHLLKDPQTGDRTPTGFVQLNSVETATKALEALNGTQTPNGETLLVSYALPRRFQPYGFSGQGSRQGSRQGPGNFGGNRSRGGPSSSRPRWN